VGIAMFAGALIGWAWGVPHYSALAASTEAAACRKALGGHQS